ASTMLHFVPRFLVREHLRPRRSRPEGDCSGRASSILASPSSPLRESVGTKANPCWRCVAFFRAVGHVLGKPKESVDVSLPQGDALIRRLQEGRKRLGAGKLRD